MFILIAVIAAILSAVLDFFFLTKKKSVKECIRVTVRNLFIVTLSAIACQRYVLKYEHFLDNAEYGAKDYLIFFAAALAVAAVWEIIFAVWNRVLVIENAPRPRLPKCAMAAKIVIVLLFALGVAAYTGTEWGRGAFGKVTGDQLLINLTSPTAGTEKSVYVDGFEGPVFKTFLLTTLFGLIVFKPMAVFYEMGKKRVKIFGDLAKRLVCLALAAFTLYYGVDYGIKKFRMEQVFNAYFFKSTIIEDNYVDPETAKITWPAQKRNLIHIYLESMENSFTSKANGGFIDKNLIPNLTKIAKTGTVFSDSDNYLGGPDTTTGTQWSLASMVNQLTGLPMKAPGWSSTYGANGTFLPGAYTLGELLEKQGYEQSVMIGSSATFGGLRYLYQNHGNWTVIDHDYALEHGLIPKGYKVKWGFEDDKLFQFAKDEITRLYNTGKPFNFTMETADTHRPDGYVTPGKDKPFKSPYANALWNSDRDVAAFLDWIREQPFYENTTIVLIGDHLSMETTFFEVYKFTEDYKRTQYNCILNADPSLGTPDENVTLNRQWSNFDYMPTIVASLGAKIEGERLGIGTNLYSGEKTLLEQYGTDYANKELEKGSDFYNKQILQVEKLQDALNPKGKGG